MKPLREKAGRVGKSRELERALKVLKGAARFVIPAIFKRIGNADEEEEILALPTVNLVLYNGGHGRTTELEWELKFNRSEGLRL